VPLFYSADMSAGFCALALVYLVMVGLETTLRGEVLMGGL
jgi:hypothetical protein